MQAKVGGTNGKVLGALVTQTAAATVKGNVMVEVDPDQLDSVNGFVEVGISAGSSLNGKVGQALLLSLRDDAPANL